MGGEDGGKISRGQIIKGHVCLGKELDFTLKTMGTNKAFKKGGGMIRFVCQHPFRGQTGRWEDEGNGSLWGWAKEAMFRRLTDFLDGIFNMRLMGWWWNLAQKKMGQVF